MQNIGLKCAPTVVVGVVRGPVNVLEDLYIFILPMPTVLALKLPRNKKIRLLLVFMTGILYVVPIT